MMRLVGVWLMAGLAISSASTAAAQCGYLLMTPVCNTGNTSLGATDCSGEALAVGACKSFGGFSQGVSCDANGDMIMKTGVMCNTSAGAVPITQLGQGRCGASCYANQQIWLSQQCMPAAAAFGTNALYAGGDCWNAKKTVCDANWVYEFKWDPADANCPPSPTKEGSVTKFPVGNCVDFSFPPFQNLSFKVDACTGPTANADTLMVTNTKFSIHTAALCTPASTIIESGETQSTACTLDTDNNEYAKNYCDGGFWGYNYGSDMSCTAANLMSVIYIKAGCLPISSIFGSGGQLPMSVQSISIGCNTPTKPPFAFSNGQAAQLTLWADAACSTQQFGGLYGQVDTCMGNVKITCNSATSATMMMYASATCTGMSAMNVTFTKTGCVVLPTGPPPAPGTQGPPPQYAKLVSCGAVSGNVDPAKAPGITLSAANERKGMAMTGLVVAIGAMVMNAF